MWDENNLILASSSTYRAKMLTDAGLIFRCMPSRLDERALEEPLIRSGAEPEDIALVLARAKAEDVSRKYADSLVIGADQTLSLDGSLIHKAGSDEETRRQLLRLSGTTHQLNSAVVLVKNGILLWHHADTAHMTMRKLSPRQIGLYMSMTKDDLPACLGGYRIESNGVQLFDAIKGDYFTIVGLPLLSLLGGLRSLDQTDLAGGSSRQWGLM